MSNSLSTFLFANPSFGEGMARILDMGGTLNIYNTSLTEKQADFLALYSDWRAVGQDIGQAEVEEYHQLLSQGEVNVRPSGEPARR